MPLRIELLDSSSSSFDLSNAAEEKKKKIVIEFPDFGQKFQSLTSSNKFNISHRSATDRVHGHHQKLSSVLCYNKRNPTTQC